MKNELQDKITAILEEYVSGGLSGELEGQIREWIAGEENSQEKKAALGELWNKFVAYAEEPSARAYRFYEEVADRLGIAKPAHAPVLRRPLHSRIALRVAAAAIPVVMAVGGYFMAVNYSGAFKDIVYSAAADETNECRLADGTTVWLNGGTKLIQDGQRSVNLDGEACFDVMRDENHPFTVNTGGLKITVLGTVFNVNNHSEGGYTVITLYEGSVKVASPLGAEYTLEPGNELVVNNETYDVNIVEIPYIKPEWMSMGITFDAEPLPYIFEALSAIFGVKFDYDAASMARQTVTLKLKGNENLAESLFLLSQVGGGFSYGIDGDTVTVSARK